jgi:hypothetical protein
MTKRIVEARSAVCLLAGIVLLAVGMLSVKAPTASAEAYYGCVEYKCAVTEGPVEYGINEVKGANARSNGVCASVFEVNGPHRGFECSADTQTVYAGNDCFSLHAWTTVSRYYKEYEYYLGGRQYLKESVCSIAGQAPTASSVQTAQTAAFGVLDHPANRSALPGSVPASAVLALERGERRVWVWELSGKPSAAARPGAAATFTSQFASSPEAAAAASSLVSLLDGSAQESELCLGGESPGVGGVPANGQSCAPVSTVAKEGEVSFSGAGGSSFPVTIKVLVPNGVENVEITEADGNTRSVKVENNVALAVVQGGENALPKQPATAVSYQMPNGSVKNVMAPAQ